MTNDRRVTVWLAAAVAVVLTVGLAQTAGAVSGGGYSPSQQDCPATADANNAGQQGSQQQQNPVPGCHSAKLDVEDGAGNRYAEAGLDQLPQGYPSTPGLLGVGYPLSANFVHSGCAAVNTAGTGGGCGSNAGGAGASAHFDLEQLASCTYKSPTSPSCAPGATPGQALTVQPDTGTGIAPIVQITTGNGLLLYFGADDNLDAGEHDGVSGNNGTAQATNGPSDGGAISAHLTPADAGTAPSAADPFPLAGLSEGQCADGFCIESTTQRQQLYSGGTAGSRDVTDYSSKQFDPYNCSSGDATSEAPPACGGTSLNDWRQQEKQAVYAEPGVQVYEDPDPQGSPIDPLYDGGATPKPVLYPLPAVYAGTCGVVVGGGPVVDAPPSPVTNSAHQVDVRPTGC